MTTVLFIHGLESGPRGKKAAALEAAGFHVVAGQMPCSRNAVLRDPVVSALLLVAAALPAFAALRFGVFGLLLTTVWCAVSLRLALPLIMRRTFTRSVAVQLKLLAEHHIDVVLGSSFGGAVALELLNRGAWKGPTILLCPAHAEVAARAWRPTPTLPADARALVVHGRLDETVPLAHSRALVARTATGLIEVDDGHRLAATATPENLRAWVARLSPLAR